MMLIETRSTRQIGGEPRRTWYDDDDMDLIVWFSESEEIIGFQICYNKKSDEHSLTWFKNKGYAHHRVDDGDIRPGRAKMTPILVQDGMVDIKGIIRRFGARAVNVPPSITVTVIERLKEFERRDNKAL